MRKPTAPRTPAKRVVGLAVAAGVAIVLLAALPISAPPSRPGRLISWWESVGTAPATMSALRAGAIGFAAWILAVTTFGILATATRSRPALRVWQATTPAAIRRLALASAVVAGAATPDATLAAEGGEAPPVVRDLGLADTRADPTPPLLHDLGPVDDARRQRPVARPVKVDTEPSGLDVWIVERGDHLWRIAGETLAERGGGTTDAEIARYWREVIALNQAAIGPDPDLIHPGMVFTLP